MKRRVSSRLPNKSLSTKKRPTKEWKWRRTSTGRCLMFPKSRRKIRTLIAMTRKSLIVRWAMEMIPTKMLSTRKCGTTRRIV